MVAFVRAFLVIVLATLVSSAQEKAKTPAPPVLQELHLKNLKARGIGPAIMGGRVSSIALDPKDRYTYYIGLGTGGVMKTSDNGATFGAIFEKEAVQAVGAIAVSPVNAKQVWVGTGEANDRNSSQWGNGVYVSTDAGGSWTNVGLKTSKTIARIALHPRDTATAFVAVMGDLWNPSPDRGLYKTTDFGKTWKLVLSAKGLENKVGCGDVMIDPQHPDTMVAALYARRRTPWSFTSGVDASDGKDAGGIFRSTDGGATWTKISTGLPTRTQRIGLDVYKANPAIMVAIVQSDEGGTSNIDEVRSKNGGVFRSEDYGQTWTRMNPLNPRPFYFSQIRIDPTNDKRIYVLGYMVHVSDDGGKSFQEDHFKNVHSDCHDLQIDPTYAKRVVLGTDGGVYQSFNGGKAWQFLPKFAGGEFYRITVDSSRPYRIAGGLQDNLNWVGPSRTKSKEGIINSDWINISGGDGFYCVFDPKDPNTIYAESQSGYVHRIDLTNGQVKGLRPEPSEGQTGYRFHWNSPLIGSVHQPGTMYLAGNRVFKLTNKGERFAVISPDLSTQDVKRIQTTGSGAETFGVVYTLAESPVKAGMLWAGTDDGKLWITRDEGGSWTDLTPNLPKSTQGMWIGRVEPGHFDAEVAYLAFVSYPSGVYSPQVYRTTDGGKTWASVAGNLPEDGPVKVLREDVKNPSLLFCGTEFNLFMSTDKGKSWLKFGGVPTNSVDDIVIHPRERDLVIATHGRSLFILDDIGALQEFTPEVAAKAAHLFTIRPADGYHLLDGWTESSGSAEYRGANPPVGAIITYFVKELTTDDAKITVTTADGRVVANLSGPSTPGFNRVVWDLKPTGDVLNSYGGEGQRFMASGEYTVTLTYGKASEKQKVLVKIAEGVETR